MRSEFIMLQFATNVSKSIFGELHYVVQQLKKKSWWYSFPYFDIFILSEWRDTGVAVATWEENNMAAQKRKFYNADK